MNKGDEIIYLYWLKDLDHTDISNDGYVGITSNPYKRLQGHSYNLQHNKDGVYFGDIQSSYLGDNVLFDIIDCGTKDEMLYKESRLRPKRELGWNIACGGYNISSDDTLSVYGEMITDRSLSEILFGNPTTIQGRKHRFPHYNVEILASKSLKFEDRENRDFTQVNGVDYYYENLSPSFVSDVINMDTEGKSVYEISNTLNVDRDKVYRVLKMFWRETTEKLNFCYKDIWFDYTSKYSAEHCYHAVKYLHNGATISDVVLVYGIPKMTVVKWGKALTDKFGKFKSKGRNNCSTKLLSFV